MTRRQPSVPDFELWAEIVRGVKPLRAGSRPPEAAKRAAAPKPPEKELRPQRPAAHPAARAPGPKAHLAPPQTGLDRRTTRRLMRGDVEIEAVIDLHGETTATAHTRLLSFLLEARRRGRRTVLVVTGKGGSPFARHTLHGARHYHAPEREGRLRRSATEWLAEPEFRRHVVAFQPAHPKHGGGGAFYVRLRRPAPENSQGPPGRRAL